MSDFETVLYKSSDSETWLSDPMGKIPNRAMYFGDGLFETMVYDGEQIRFWDFHSDRLSSGLTLLGFEDFKIPATEITHLADFYGSGKPLRIRWTVYREGLGKYSPESNLVSQVLHFQPFHPAPKVKEIAGFSESIFLVGNSFSSLKTISALPYVLANQEKVKKGLDELILLDNKGNISEGSASNIFWMKDGRVFTPSLSTGCIDGIGRRVLIEKLAQMGYEVNEGEFGQPDLLNADLVWVSNVTGISMIHQIENQKFDTNLPDFLENIL